MPVVTFNPGGRAVEAARGESLWSVASRGGVSLPAPCGGKGKCGKCRVLVSPAPEPTPSEREFLDEVELARGLRLACHMRVEADVDVKIPGEAMLREERILVDGSTGSKPVAPAVEVVPFELQEPAIGSAWDDLTRLSRSLGRGEPAGAALHALRRLPGMLRENSFRGLAVLSGGALLDVLPLGSEASVVGAAFDIGTTTLAGSLVSLTSGRVLATSSRANPQARYGDDVVSRMDYARRGAAELDELRRLVAGDLDAMLGEMTSTAGLARANVYRVSVAGNTVMTHLFLGVPPANIAVAPFVPAFTSAVEADARETGFSAAEGASLIALPCVAGYIGGDIVGGLVATGVPGMRGVTLYIDIGTNGEVVLARDGELWACSVAAGPAFEGARISQGMRAASGAIDTVRLEESGLFCGTVAGGRPLGICGTGLIDAAAVLLEAGLLDEYGLMRSPGDEPEGLPKFLSGRLAERSGQSAFLLAGERGSGGVWLTQRDVRELQLAKGAVAAGIAILLRELKLEAADVDRALLAGGFGTFVDRKNVLKVGLLPQAIGSKKVDFVGNASAAGARLALVSQSSAREAAEVARATRYVELSGRADFQATFAESMLFTTWG